MKTCRPTGGGGGAAVVAEGKTRPSRCMIAHERHRIMLDTAIPVRRAYPCGSTHRTFSPTTSPARRSRRYRRIDRIQRRGTPMRSTGRQNATKFQTRCSSHRPRHARRPRTACGKRMTTRNVDATRLRAGLGGEQRLRRQPARPDQGRDPGSIPSRRQLRRIRRLWGWGGTRGPDVIVRALRHVLPASQQ